MPDTTATARPDAFLGAGALYLLVILCGIGAEALLRGPLIDPADAAGTAEAMRAGARSFRLALAADLVMVASDVGLAILLFAIFRPVAPGLALAAMVFRLVQAAVISANLLFMQQAWLLVSAVPEGGGLASGQAEALALVLLSLHAHGYDLGLVFFGINSLVTGALILRSGLFPKILGPGVAIAGCVYLIGSGLRFLAPAWFEVFMPAYGLCVVAETAFCVALLVRGLGAMRAVAA